MLFFEGKTELYQMLFLLVIPAGIPLLMFFSKRKRRKRLWLSPIMALILGIVLTVIFYPYYITDLFSNNHDVGNVGYWFVFMLPVHFTVAVVATAFFYTVNYFMCRNYIMDVVTVNSPAIGIVRVKVEQIDFNTVHYTLLDGISAGYGFTSHRSTYISRTDRGGAWISAVFTVLRYRRTLPPISREDAYNEAQKFVEQLGPSGYLDDGP